MEESQPSEKSKEEKSLPTTTKSKPELKILPFSEKNRSKEEILDMFAVALDDFDGGLDEVAASATCGIVILSNPEDPFIENSVTVYTTPSHPVKLIGILEMVKKRILENS
jgi:hypothetical protein